MLARRGTDRRRAGPTADRADELTAVGERGCTPADVMAGLTAPAGSPDLPRMSGARQW